MPSFLDVILVDEVGIESGRVGGFLLRSVYQPVFSLARDCLQISAFQASIQVEREGEVRSLDDLLDASLAIDADFLADLCQALQIGNHRNLSLPGCELFLEHDLSRNRRLRDALLDAARHARAVGEAALEAGQVVCRIAGAAHLADRDRPTLLDELRGAGFRLAFDLFDDGGAGTEPRYQPDVAEISGSWLAKIAAESAAARLLRPLVDAHRREGTCVFVRGIATAEHLRVAIDAGADYFAGDYLAPAAPVGSMVDEDPQPLGNLLQPRSLPRRA
jgi:EAL domain-containing protein (putative c-di-GMP-specific phosphodiesterase class I)